MTDAVGTHYLMGTTYTTSSPISLVTGNVGFHQNFEVENMMSPASGASVLARGDAGDPWSVIEAGRSVSVRVTDGSTLDVGFSSPFYRYQTVSGDPSAEVAYKIRVSAGYMS